MAQTSDLGRVTAIVLRAMRRPMMALVAVYAIAILGLVLIPGENAAGEPAYISFFHAFYFLTYTATTTGFGEIPHPFSDAQRMWAIVCLYTSVIAWFYAIGAIIGVIQNPHFKQAVAERRFSRSVKHITEPFFIICGFGDTGSLLARGLDDAGLTAVIIDSNPDRIKALALRDYRVAMPGLSGDASLPQHLIDAGLHRPNCSGVVALSDNDAANLKIAIMVRLLNPSIQMVCRSTTRAHEELLAALGSVTVVDPFETFAIKLCTARYTPPVHTLHEWLIGAHGVTLDKPLVPPMGTWILCGYGRMGSWLYEALHSHHVPTVVIDPGIEDVEGIEHKVVGEANVQTLKAAGIEKAVGVVAATNSDSDNLGILLLARTLNPELFLVVRQNLHENEMAFHAANADLIMQPSLITARSILFSLISPMIQEFLEYLRTHPDGRYQGHVIDRIWDAVGHAQPRLWTVEITASGAPAVIDLQAAGETVTLGDVRKDPAGNERALECIALVLNRAGNDRFVPEESTCLEPGDEILYCGSAQAQRQLAAFIHSAYDLRYSVTGVVQPRGYLMRWLWQRLGQREVTLRETTPDPME